MSTSNDTTSKVCTKCGEEKPASEFYKKSESRDGLQSQCKACRIAYRRANKEKVAACQAAYRKANAERIKAQEAAHYEANREQILARNARYYAANREKIIAQKTAWQRANREHRRAYMRAWAKAHPEARAARVRNYEARKRNAPGSHTAEDVRIQYDRQKGCCFYCGEKVGGSYHVDHVVPLSKGGSNGPENLVVSCPDCNWSKNNKHPMEFAEMML